MSDRYRHLARLRPDEPQWLDLRGFLLSGRCDVFGNAEPETGLIVRSWDHDVSVAMGRPKPDVIAAAIEGATDGWHVLAAPESEATLAARLPDWQPNAVTLHWGHCPPVASGPDSDSAVAGNLRHPYELRRAGDGWKAASWDLGNVPEEYETAGVARRPMVAAFKGARPVAFCYAAVESETLWDVSVDTLEGHRRRGLAAACFAALVPIMAERGKQPVWAALDENTASVRLARRLGFRPVARLTSFLYPDDSGD